MNLLMGAQYFVVVVHLPASHMKKKSVEFLTTCQCFYEKIPTQLMAENLRGTFKCEMKYSKTKH
jgi:hypothetical protein